MANTKRSPAACAGRASKANLKVQPAHHTAFAPQSQYPGPATTPKSGGRRPRAKGNRAERALMRLLQDQGFAAERARGGGQ